MASAQGTNPTPCKHPRFPFVDGRCQHRPAPLNRPGSSPAHREPGQSLFSLLLPAREIYQWLSFSNSESGHVIEHHSVDLGQHALHLVPERIAEHAQQITG
jgi:hypothetical protein